MTTALRIDPLHTSHSRSSIEKRGEACLFFRCQTWIFALSSSHVERLLMLDEISFVTENTLAKQMSAIDFSSQNTTAGPEIVQAASSLFVAWDLGYMMEITSPEGAWVLLRVPHASKEIPIALRVGPCLVVQSLPEVTALPPRVFRARRKALSAAFSTENLGENLGESLVGLFLDPRYLWTPPELDQSLALLETIRDTKGS